MVAQQNQIALLTHQLSHSPDSPASLAFPEGATVSMETNDGFLEDGQTIFEIDQFDMDLLDGADTDVDILND